MQPNNIPVDYIVRSPKYDAIAEFQKFLPSGVRFHLICRTGDTMAMLRDTKTTPELVHRWCAFGQGFLMKTGTTNYGPPPMGTGDSPEDALLSLMQQLSGKLYTTFGWEVVVNTIDVPVVVFPSINVGYVPIVTTDSPAEVEH